MLEYLMKRCWDWGFLLIAVGATAIVVSGFADSISVGRPGFGVEQLSGLVIGVLVVAAGVVKVLFANSSTLARILTGIYLSGILFVGLRANPFKYTQYKILLDVNSFDLHAFAINTAGFIPLWYLLILSFGNRQKDQRTNMFKRATIAVGGGSLISLFLEVSQYYLISGRHSSLFDWIFNAFGTIMGIALYILVEQEKGMGTEMKGLQQPGGSSQRNR
jgi:glycopeptide antibiotics resistance protein